MPADRQIEDEVKAFRERVRMSTVFYEVSDRYLPDRLPVDKPLEVSLPTKEPKVMERFGEIRTIPRQDE